MLMLQQKQPDDYVVSTGRMETIRKFVELCAEKLVGEILLQSSNYMESSGINETGRRY